MSTTVARIMLSLVTLFFSVLLFIATAYILIEQYYFFEMSLIYAGFPAGFFAISAWIIIWHRPKIWNMHRIRRLVFAVLGSCACGIVVLSLLLLLVDSIEEEFAFTASTAFAILCSITSLILIIKETPAERKERLRNIGFIKIVCPACKYDMRGLHTTDCPECGHKCSLEEYITTLREQQAPPTIDDSDN